MRKYGGWIGPIIHTHWCVYCSWHIGFEMSINFVANAWMFCLEIWISTFGPKDLWMLSKIHGDWCWTEDFQNTDWSYFGIQKCKYLNHWNVNLLVSAHHFRRNPVFLVFEILPAFFHPYDLKRSISCWSHYINWTVMIPAKKLFSLRKY